MKAQPMQPVVKIKGQEHFRPNKIVEFLLDSPLNKVDLNLIASMDFPAEDRRQFAQLIGYSVNGYGELPYAENKLGCKCPIHKAARAEFRKEAAAK